MERMTPIEKRWDRKTIEKKNLDVMRFICEAIPMYVHRQRANDRRNARREREREMRVKKLLCIWDSYTLQCTRHNDARQS